LIYILLGLHFCFSDLVSLLISLFFDEINPGKKSEGKKFLLIRFFKENGELFYIIKSKIISNYFPSFGIKLGLLKINF